MLVPRTKSTRLVLPRGVAGSSDEPADADEGTLSYDTATGLIRIKTSAGWVDATGGGGGGGGGVTSFNGRAGAVVPLAGDYTKSDVGLSNVTNDPQWASTLSNQIRALTAKSPLVAADELPIEDSATSWAKKKVTAAVLAAFVAQSQGLRGNMWTTPPPTPSAYDDEFLYGSSPDLATRGWTVTNDSGTTMTRLGDVIWSAAPSGMTTTNYRSTVTPEGLAIQTAAATHMNVCKNITGSWGFSCEMHPNHLNTDNAYFYEAPMLWDVYPAKLDNTMRRILWANYNGTVSAGDMNVNQIFSSRISGVSSNFPSAPWWTTINWNSSSKVWDGLAADPYQSRIMSPDHATPPAFSAFTLASAGFAVRCGRAQRNSWMTVRSFRAFTQGTLPFIP